MPESQLRPFVREAIGFVMPLALLGLSVLSLLHAEPWLAGLMATLAMASGLVAVGKAPRIEFTTSHVRFLLITQNDEEAKTGERVKKPH
jgi:hypothetical protein